MEFWGVGVIYQNGVHYVYAGKLNMDDILKINDSRWKVGTQRATTIQSLAKQNVCSKKSISEAAILLELSERYIYRLIRKYRESHGILTSLIPQKPNGGKGKPKLSTIQESLIT